MQHRNFRNIWLLNLSKTDKNYNLAADTIYYYENTIVPEGQITQDEFLELCKEVAIKIKC